VFSGELLETEASLDTVYLFIAITSVAMYSLILPEVILLKDLDERLF
jgi:hypothetical protein